MKGRRDDGRREDIWNLFTETRKRWKFMFGTRFSTAIWKEFNWMLDIFDIIWFTNIYYNTNLFLMLLSCVYLSFTMTIVESKVLNYYLIWVPKTFLTQANEPNDTKTYYSRRNSVPWKKHKIYIEITLKRIHRKIQTRHCLISNINLIF